MSTNAPNNIIEIQLAAWMAHKGNKIRNLSRPGYVHKEYNKLSGRHDEGND